MMRYHFIPTRMTIIKRDNSKFWWKDYEKLEPHTLLMECKMEPQFGKTV